MVYFSADSQNMNTYIKHFNLLHLGTTGTGPGGKSERFFVGVRRIGYIIIYYGYYGRGTRVQNQLYGMGITQNKDHIPRIQ